MTEVKYSSHIYDLSIKRVDVPIDLGGGSINVIAIKGDCFIKLNDKSQDPINLLYASNIKTTFTKFYLSNNVQVGGYVAIVVGKSCEFELTTNIARATHKQLLLPQQNIPEHLINKVIDTPKLINVWNIKNAVLRYTFSVTAQDTEPSGVFFRQDGLKVYIIGRFHGNINEYDLGTAWDISTAVFKHSFNLILQNTNPFDLFFSYDGSFMYVVDLDRDSVFQYALSIKWNVTTASHLFTFSVAAQTALPSSVVFNPSGSKMFITGVDNNSIIEYNLSAAWDISTAVFKRSFNISYIITSPRAIFFSPDGLKVYVVGGHPNKVIAYRILEAWNVTTSVYIQSFDYTGIVHSPRGLFFRPDGLKMYMVSGHPEYIYEFDL